MHNHYTKVTHYLHIKQAMAKRKNNRGNRILKPVEIRTIRNLLPSNYRQIIAEKHTSITLRQITEVINQRTKNPVYNYLVWSTINEFLQNAERTDLAERVQILVNIYLPLYNIIQNGSNAAANC